MAFITTFNKFYQRSKNIIHSVQALLIFVAAMITIAIFTKSGQSDTRITYFFVLCLICIPFLIYQTAFPTFRKSRKLANAYAHTIIDTLLAILWLAAFIGEIVWAKDGTKAAKDFKSGDSTCQVFGYGATDKCHLGQITSIFGVVICILFALTTALSTYALLYYRKNGTLPGNDIPSTDPNTGKGDDLKFTGASPHAYDVLQVEQEMHEHDLPQQHQSHQPNNIQMNGWANLNNNTDTIDSPPHTPTTIQLRESEAHATLPPLPIYTQAPHSPLTTDFDHPTPNNHFLAPNSSYHPEHYSNARLNEYEGYRNDSGDYSLPSSPGLRLKSPNPRIGAAELPSLMVNTTRRGEVAFPVGDYGR